MNRDLERSDSRRVWGVTRAMILPKAFDEADPRRREMAVPVDLHVREVERIGAQHPEVRPCTTASPSGISRRRQRDRRCGRAEPGCAPAAHHFDDERHDSSTPSTRVSAARKPRMPGEPPRARAHVVERRDRQHEEERLGVDGREEDRRRKDRDVEDRAPRDGAVVFVLDQLVEIEQAEEERGVRDEQPGDRDGCRRATPTIRISNG